MSDIRTVTTSGAIIPGVYAAWVSWLEAFGRAEDLPTTHLPLLDADTLGPDMLGRILQRVQEAYGARVQRWNELLDRDSRHASTPDGLARILVESRRRLAPLVRLSRLPQLPTDVRVALAKSLADSLAGTQKSLEQSARANPAIERQLLGVVQQHPLHFGLTTQTVDPDPPPSQSAGASRRPLIL